MIGRHEGGTGDGRIAVDDSSFEEPFNTLGHGRLCIAKSMEFGYRERGTHVDYTAECADSIWAVDDFGIWLHVLHDTARDHYDILSRSCEFLDSQVDCLSKSTLGKSIKNMLPVDNLALTSLCWKSFVVPKNSSVASCVPNVSPT